MGLNKMGSGLKRNKEWDKLPDEGKQKIYENLPFPFPFVLAILLFLIYGTPFVLRLFPNLNISYYEWIRIPLIVIYMLFIIGHTSWNYKKKTSHNLNEDIVEIQNKRDLDKKKSTKQTI